MLPELAHILDGGHHLHYQQINYHLQAAETSLANERAEAADQHAKLAEEAADAARRGQEATARAQRSRWPGTKRTSRRGRATWRLSRQARVNLWTPTQVSLAAYILAALLCMHSIQAHPVCKQQQQE